MDDILKRLGAVEISVSDIRAQVSAHTAVFPHLATKADMHAMETRIIKWIVGTATASAAVASAIASVVAKLGS